MSKTNQHPLDAKIADRQERIGRLEDIVRKSNQELIVTRAELQAFLEAKELTPIAEAQQKPAPTEEYSDFTVLLPERTKSYVQSTSRLPAFAGGGSATSDTSASRPSGTSSPVSWPDVFRKLEANEMDVFGYDDLVQAAEILGHSDVKKSSCRAVIMDYVNKGWLSREKPGQFALSRMGKHELGLTRIHIRFGDHPTRPAQPSRAETGGAEDTSPLPYLNPSPSVGEQE